jgi:hypothetical protein
MKFSLKLLPLVVMLAMPACVDMDMGEDDTVNIEDGAEISLEWIIVADDQPVSCVDAGASEIEVAILGDTEVRERTSCFGGFAVIDAQGEGSPLIEVSLVSPAGDRLVTVELGEVELIPGATLPLGAIELTL